MSDYSVPDLLAKVFEYEHALEHIAEDSEHHKPAGCVDCQRLARTALDGANRDSFREMADDVLNCDSPEAGG